MYSYFSFTTIERLKDVASLSQYIDKFDIKVGGIFPLVALNELLLLLEFKPNELAQRLNPQHPIDFQLCVFPDNFVTRFCAYGDAHLAAISARWAMEEYWETVTVNPFDLYGFLLELQSFCKTCRPEAGRIVCAIASDD